MEEDIILYTQPGCPQCKMVHMALDNAKINYTECQDMEVMRNKGITGTPAIEYNGEIIKAVGIKNFIHEHGAK